MSTKSNFLISVVEKSEKTDFTEYSNLININCINVGNLKITLNYSNNAKFIKSPDANVVILFSGNIYQDDLFGSVTVEQYLLNKYLEYKKDFVKYLNGSFCLFFAQVNSGEVYFATDRLNTRKIFSFKKENKLLFTTDIHNLPLRKCKLNYAGIASYLTNGVIYNNLTLFKEITKLERASLHKIVNFKIITEKYWDTYYTNEYSNNTESELSEEQNRLYIQSLKRIIKGKKNIYISLSGGIDSRGLAAMVKEIAENNSNIICLSHNFGNSIEGTDSDSARLVAENLGFPFKLLNSYNGDPFHTIQNNAKVGQGIAHFCIESDAWEQINKEFIENENCILLDGDLHEGTFEFHGNIKRAFERSEICESSFLKEFKNYFNLDTFSDLCEAWDEEYNLLMDKVSHMGNLVDIIGYLYIDQCVPNKYSVARECFQMPVIETASPYYDNEILDFNSKLNSDMRYDKKLHRISLNTKYPGLFKIKYPLKGWGNEPNWINEIKSFAEIFINNIKNEESELDNIIPPGNIIKTILESDNTEKNKFISNTVLKPIHNTIKKVFPSYYKIIEMLPGGEELTRKAGRFVNPRITHILPNILILRQFLAKK